MYTKGEWKVRHPTNCDYTIYSGVWGDGIKQVAVVQETYPNAEANAHLIAAAPDMYEALKEIAEGKGRYSLDHLKHASNTIEDMKALAVEALSKAEEK